MVISHANSIREHLRMWHRSLELHKSFEMHFLTGDYTGVWHSSLLLSFRPKLTWIAKYAACCSFSLLLEMKLLIEAPGSHGFWTPMALCFLVGARFLQLKLPRLAWVFSLNSQKGICFCSCLALPDTTGWGLRNLFGFILSNEFLTWPLYCSLKCKLYQRPNLSHLFRPQYLWS